MSYVSVCGILSRNNRQRWGKITFLQILTKNIWLFQKYVLSLQTVRKRNV